MKPISKVVLLGNENSGKTALFNGLMNREFSEEMPTTVDVDFMILDLSKIQIKLLDSARKNEEIITARTILYCVDLSKALDKESIITELNAYPEQSAAIILVGTKSDLDELQITEEELETFAQEQGYAKVLLTSAKTNHNLDALIDELQNLNYLSQAQILMLEKLAAFPQVTLFRYLLEELVVILTDCLPTDCDSILYAVIQLLDALKEKSSAEQKLLAIQAFQDNCHSILTQSTQLSFTPNSYSTVLKAVLIVTMGVVVTLITALIGFGIGFAAGWWMGPAAFISGIMSGANGATATLSISTGLGVAAGTLKAHSLFKSNPIAPQRDIIAEIANAAQIEMI